MLWEKSSNQRLAVELDHKSKIRENSGYKWVRRSEEVNQRNFGGVLWNKTSLSLDIVLLPSCGCSCHQRLRSALDE